MSSNKIETYGFDALQETMKELGKEFGVINARKNILVPAAKKAFQPVLEAAKNNLVPGHGYDTGQLKRTLRINAQPVKQRNRRSKYINKDDVVYATVSAKVVKKYVEATNAKGGKKLKSIGDVSDARAIALEFGTANMAARPYLRPALESNYQNVVELLRVELAKAVQQFSQKNMGKDK